ncbi:MAG: TetR/AcrR family transcriptional regulator [Polyangiaceae bacterium]|nr:TetR/AcrR family transcriptional regulator [Polyangiaceae bacterium]
MGSATRQELISAANEVFSHFGYKKASIEDIARIAGVGKGSVYLHFDSKEALFEAVIRQILTKGILDLEAKVEAATAPDGKLRAFIEERMAQGATLFRFGFDGLPKDVSSLMSIAESVGVVRKVVLEFREREIALLNRIIDEGREASVFHISDTPTIALGLHTVVYGGIAAAHSGGDATRSSYKAVIDILFRGLKAQP